MDNKIVHMSDYSEKARHESALHTLDKVKKFVSEEPEKYKIFILTLKEEEDGNDILRINQAQFTDAEAYLNLSRARDSYLWNN